MPEAYRELFAHRQMNAEQRAAGGHSFEAYGAVQFLDSFTDNVKPQAIAFGTLVTTEVHVEDAAIILRVYPLAVIFYFYYHLVALFVGGNAHIGVVGAAEVDGILDQVLDNDPDHSRVR